MRENYRNHWCRIEEIKLIWNPHSRLRLYSTVSWLRSVFLAYADSFQKSAKNLPRYWSNQAIHSVRFRRNRSGRHRYLDCTAPACRQAGINSWKDWHRIWVKEHSIINVLQENHYIHLEVLGGNIVMLEYQWIWEEPLIYYFSQLVITKPVLTFRILPVFEKSNSSYERIYRGRKT